MKNTRSSGANTYSTFNCQTLKKIGRAALSHCAFKELDIAESVTTIDDYAFNGNEFLQQITIGSGVQFIGLCVLENCNNLKKVISRIPDGSKVSLVDAFYGVNEDCVLYIPRGSKNSYKSTKGWSNFSKIVEMDM